MKLLTHIITKYLLGCLLLITVTGLSLPTHMVQAGGISGGATVWQQLIDGVEQKLQTVQQTISAGANVTTAGAQVSIMAKENLLDGIGWAIAKQMVSSMTQSLLNWINSGFQGSPAFITDLNGFLLDALDTAAGEYIKSLGFYGEFICSPFRLDVQAALSINYAAARSGMPSGPSEPSCKLSDIGNNIEDFMNGSMTDWGQWLTITSNPQNTPFGAYLEAEAKLNIKLRNEAGQEIEIASWSDGFLSKRVCEMIEGQAAGQGTNCRITTPGKVISEALTFQLSTGARTLIEADEINEIIGALINQLTLKAMQGINGLLGLGGNSNYTDNSYGPSGTQSFIDAAVDDEIATLASTTNIKPQIDASLASEITYQDLTITTLSEANRRLTLVTAGQNAIATLFTEPGSSAGAMGFSVGSTPTQAQTAINAKITQNNNDQGNCDSGLFDSCTASEQAIIDADRALITKAQNELNVVYASLDIIKAMDPSLGLGGDLKLVSFTELIAGGTDVQADLVALINEISTLQPGIAQNISELNALIVRWNTASATADITAIATSSRTVGGIQQGVVNDYLLLLQRNVLTNAATVDLKRTLWRQRLP